MKNWSKLCGEQIDIWLVYQWAQGLHKDFILQKNVWRHIGRVMGMDALNLANLGRQN